MCVYSRTVVSRRHFEGNVARVATPRVRVLAFLMKHFFRQSRVIVNNIVDNGNEVIRNMYIYGIRTTPANIRYTYSVRTIYVYLCIEIDEYRIPEFRTNF